MRDEGEPVAKQTDEREGAHAAKGAELPVSFSALALKPDQEPQGQHEEQLQRLRRHLRPELSDSLHQSPLESSRSTNRECSRVLGREQAQ